MSKIKLLSLQEIQKIAAGEVVERPANIVKELIENALDAQATHIKIMIEDGGKECIRVIDNGCGMSMQDARLSIANHATSKITTVDDLNSIQTFGFRGEALSSIAAISHMTITTKDEQSAQGITLIIENGDIKQEIYVACPTGTDITINDVFYNVPARKKFLKKRETEYRHIAQLVHAIALSHPAIHISLYSEGNEIINCPSAHSLQERCAQLWKYISQNSLHEIHENRDGIAEIAGIISNQHHIRYDRSELYFFVNSRWITNYSLVHALLKGFDNLLPKGRYPYAAINITCDPQLVDINIHPRKEEVRFLHPKIIESLIQQAVKKSLEKSTTTLLQKSTINIPLTIPSTSHIQFSHQIQPSKSISHHDSTNSLAWNYRVDNNDQKPEVYLQNQLSQTFSKQTPITHEIEESSIQTYQLIGQYKKTYLLLEQEDGLFLIDQHAAHERILYEKFASHFESPVTTNLLFPTIVTMTRDEMSLLEPYLSLFHDIGIILEPFSAHQFIISATPVCAPHIAYDELVRQTIGWIAEEQTESQMIRTIVHQKMHAQMACKAAVKAGDVLTQETMEQLLRDLYTCPNRFSCPHGRPTGWLLPLSEIEKKFKRNYKN